MMKFKKGTILNLGAQNRPVPGCTISEEVYREQEGSQSIHHLVLPGRGY